ncbi:coiled-coil domain-containing protein mad1 [Orbilia javanica]|uniref:Spindle assembly checkpoint component MAD1 n=1 Tax=Orbilia javanica TaxID=47235 RepID=A0AAN8MVV3_9PEZI
MLTAVPDDISISNGDSEQPTALPGLTVLLSIPQVADSGSCADAESANAFELLLARVGDIISLHRTLHPKQTNGCKPAAHLHNTPVYPSIRPAMEPVPPSHFHGSVLVTTDTSVRGHSPQITVDSAQDAILIELNAVKYELATIKQERELENISSRKEIHTLQKRVQEDGKLFEQERSEKNFIFERHQALASELESVCQAATNTKVTFERQLRDAEAGNLALKEANHDLETAYDTLQRKYQHEMEDLRTQTTLAREQANNLTLELASREDLLQEYTAKLREREDEILRSQGQVEIAKEGLEGDDTLKVLKRELADQLSHTRAVEARNRKLELENEELRSYNKSISLMEEERRSLKSKVQALDGLREKVSNLELQKAILEEERLSWTAFLQDDPDGVQFTSPAHLAKAYVQAKIEKTALLEKFGRPDPLIAERDQEIKDLVATQTRLGEENQSMKQRINKDSKEKQRLERQKELALKEATFLREQLKTYSTEEEVMMAGNYDDQKSQRIEELERLLGEHKNEINALTRQLQERDIARAADLQRLEEGLDHRRSTVQFQERIDSLYKELEISKQAHKMASVEIKALQKQLAASEATSRMRVLQLKDNPAARHEVTKLETLRVLREENKALLAQLEGQPGGTKFVPISTLERSRLDVQEMEALVVEKEKRMTRLKEMWSKKALEFRQAVYSLLGYEVDFQPNGRVKVTSMFHRSDLYGGVDTGIVFDGEQGTMKLCGGPNSQFAREIRNQLKFYVEERKEIPCFLAALTMEGYEKTTRAQQ